MTFDKTYISLGAGVQSSALLILSALGRLDVPRADFAVFADTGDEPAYVYEQLDRLEKWVKPHGIQIFRTGAGIALSDAIKVRWVPLPLFTRSAAGKVARVKPAEPAPEFELVEHDKPRKKERTRDDGMLRRQCTNEFKLEPINRFVRLQLGYKPRQVIRMRVRNMIGFSAEEYAFRAKPSRERWITSVYPLADAKLYRSQCAQIVEDAGLGTPKKSACVFCPYHSDRHWAEMKRDQPEDFEKACQVDEMIRNAATRDAVYTKPTAEASMRKLRERSGFSADEVFIHRSLRPLREVEFGDQPSMFEEECTGSW